jgi:uncharacterized protein YdeI (YjbR/CyaY-like superfamily)
MTPTFFVSAAALRSWLKAKGTRVPVLWVGFYKAGSGRRSLTYRQALDEALCFGWIDGVRKSLDAERWTIRFTPRKARSRWSRVNLKRAAELKAAGRMAPVGLRALGARDRTPRRGYSYENQPKRLAPAREKAFRLEAAAWTFFEAQPPSYRRKAIFWVESAAQEETRQRRLRALLEASRGKRRLV